MRLGLVLDFSLRTRYVIGNAPLNDCKDEVEVVAPDRYVHARFTTFVLGIGIQIVLKKILANVDVTLERA